MVGTLKRKLYSRKSIAVSIKEHNERVRTKADCDGTKSCSRLTGAQWWAFVQFRTLLDSGPAQIFTKVDESVCSLNRRADYVIFFFFYFRLVSHAVDKKLEPNSPPLFLVDSHSPFHLNWFTKHDSIIYLPSSELRVLRVSAQEDQQLSGNPWRGKQNSENKSSKSVTSNVMVTFGAAVFLKKSK